MVSTEGCSCPHPGGRMRTVKLLNVIGDCFSHDDLMHMDDGDTVVLLHPFNGWSQQPP